MTVSYTYSAHVFTQRFNADWSEVITSYLLDTMTLQVPDAETSFTLGEFGAFDYDALADHQLFYTSSYGEQAIFLGPENPVAISHVTHDDGTAIDALRFDIHIRASDGTVLGFDTIILPVAGDAMPEFADAAAFNTWLSSGAGWWVAPETGPYSAGSTASWGDFAIPTELVGTAGNDLLQGSPGSDTIRGGDGSDTLIGGAGDDVLFGGDGANDLRDVIYGGDGDDSIDGGYGNDELRGDAGADTITGGFGVDTIIGGTGNDLLTGQAWSDLIFGGDGDDFINGGFGFDRVNGGAGADKFFHLGIADHGSDWIQDYNSADGDVLQFGGPANTAASDFLIQRATTATAGADAVQEVFVTQISTGNLLWALVDGDAQAQINIQIGSGVFDLLA